MLKVLLKKQLAEVFRSYFFDAKKNRLRSKGAIAGWFIFFILMIVGVGAGVFGSMSYSLCGPLTAAGMGWLYFLIMGGIAVVLGTFGSVFNTYSGLYLSKDNDLLLSLPIPVRTIVAARLLSVYLMGALYSAVAFFPALIVYWFTAGAGASRVICGLLLYLIVTVFVLLLSALLGWVVARLSRRLKNRSLIAVLVSLLFIFAYYFVYFKASKLIGDLLQNADVYGERIKGAAYGLYLFGRVGEGDWSASLLFLVLTALLLALTWYFLQRSFLGIATGGGAGARVRYVEKTAKEKSPFGALLMKELRRYGSSPNYILNCSLGLLFPLLMGAAILVKGAELLPAINQVLAGRPDSAAILLCTVICLVSGMNDIAAPSVSLEGKSVWIPQSLPIHPKHALRAKSALQLILTGGPTLFAGVCAAVTVSASVPVRLLVCLVPLFFAGFTAVLDTVIGVRLPVMNWTNELVPIKQSGAVILAMLGGWALSVVFCGLYLAVGYVLGAAVYLLLWVVLLSVGTLSLLRWLDTRGAAAFASL